MTQGNMIRAGEQGGLISYLAKLGLGDADLARVMSLLPAARVLDETQPTQLEEPARASKGEWPSRGEHGKGQLLQDGQPRHLGPRTSKKALTLFLAEEQQILREAYLSFFSQQSFIDVIGSTEDTSTESLAAAARELNPDVMLLGVKRVQESTVETLERLREASPKLSLVLLFAFYDARGMKALREFARDAAAGCAYLLKHTIDTVEQLTQVICSVAGGRIIVDPMVMESLIKTGDPHASFLGELSPKELEVLSWLAKGYRNETIADVLSRDVKTVERHINNIYSKLQNGKSEDSDDSMQPRVRAALAYLRATGLLSTEQHLGD